MKIKGMDLSKWNSVVDFNRAKADGIQFVILRSSFRHTTDSQFMNNVIAAREAGVVVLGVYHFSYAMNTAQAVSEARYCLEQIQAAELPKDTMVFFDFEYDSIAKAKDAGVYLTAVDANAHAKAFCEFITKAGYTAGIYTNYDYYKNIYDHDLLKRYKLWLADYSGDMSIPRDVMQYTSTGKVDGIDGNVCLDYYWMDTSEAPVVEDGTATHSSAVVNLVNSWIGKNEQDGSFRDIIDIYNSQTKFPRGVKMDYSMAWCAATVSAAAIKLGYEKVIPIEISCNEMIKKAIEMGIWVEDDKYAPLPGDIIVYDWNSGISSEDCIGWPDHVGVVTYVNTDERHMLVTEGNYGNAVGVRDVPLDYVYTRGFIVPAYDVRDTTDTAYSIQKEERPKVVADIVKEVIAGVWGSGEERKQKLEAAGYDYKEIQDYVNLELAESVLPSSGGFADPGHPADVSITARTSAHNYSKNIAGVYNVTASALNIRDGAGTNFVSLGKVVKNSKVRCYGYYSQGSGGVKWLYVTTVVGSTKITGFACSSYLKRK